MYFKLCRFQFYDYDVIFCSGAEADILLQPGDLVIFGAHQLEVRATPGHTNGCVTYVSHKEKLAFTGIKNEADFLT